MQTLTVTAARAQLGHWLARAVRGEEIGVVVGAQIVALRPVPIQAADYMETEYGLTREEADRVATRIKAETQSAKAKGTLRSLDELAASLPHATRRSRKKRQPRAGKARA
jgi:antitoxin (DNA-binding transcriptional repressor) of toxin-antitoxin stability system